MDSRTITIATSKPAQGDVNLQISFRDVLRKAGKKMVAVAIDQQSGSAQFNPIKEHLFERIKNSDTIQELIVHKKFDQIINEIAEKCYDAVIEMEIIKLVYFFEKNKQSFVFLIM